MIQFPLALAALSSTPAQLPALPAPLPPLLLARFMPLDWVVLGAYFVVLVLTGIWFSRRKQTGTEDYFLGGRQMPVWAVAISILATSQSAATFIGGPQQAYVGNLTYLSSNIGMVLAALVVAFVFIPAFYRLNVSTPYGMLKERFGEGAVEATSHAYIFGRILASGSRVYMAAIPVALIVFGAETTPRLWLATNAAGMDANSDGIVTLGEFEKDLAATFTAYDADGDDQIAQSELADWSSQAQPILTGFVGDYAAIIDRDADGSVSQDELEGITLDLFAQADANGDGGLTSNELSDRRPWQVVFGVLLLTLVGIVYTLVGGIRSVIWTDVIQCGVYVGATVAALFILLDRIPVGLDVIWETLRTGGAGGSSKLTVVDPGIDAGEPWLGFNPSANYTLLTALIGFTLLGIASYGTDQDMVQRMLTCETAKKGASTVIGGIVVGVPVVLLFMVVGLLLWVFYTRPDLMGEASPGYTPAHTREVFLQFILRELPQGVSGLMLAGLFAAGLSSVNSTLNAMSSTFTNNFYKRYVRNRDEAHYLRIGRLGVVGFGIVLGLFAGACAFLNQKQTLIDFALSVMNFAYAGLLGVFFTALFTRRGNTRTVIAALLVGAFAVLLMQPWFWPLWTEWLPGVNADPDGPDLTDFRLAFPWQGAIAAGIAFLVCVSGSPQKPGPPVVEEVK